MKKTAKEQAMSDMVKLGICVNVLIREKEILEFTATENSIRIDFRKFNGGYHPKKKH